MNKETWFAVSHPQCWNQPLALFGTQEEAVEWGRNNYPSQYLTKQIELPIIKLFTDEEIKQSEKDAAETMEKLGWTNHQL